MGLTFKKQRYAEARIAGVPKARAAIQAGYSMATAPNAAWRLDKDPVVVAAIRRMTACDRPSSLPANSGTPQEPRRESGAFMPAPAEDPLVFLKGVMNDPRADPKLRVDAAKVLASYMYAKPGERGQNDRTNSEIARLTAESRFPIQSPPRRASNN